MNLYRVIIERHTVIEMEKWPNEDALIHTANDYIKNRGIFFYDGDKALIDMDFDFSINEDPMRWQLGVSDTQLDLNKLIYDNAKSFNRNIKLEDLNI